ncbi:MAG TPA: hypothetical protein VEJ89_04185 [Myxococcaceae bacterium]|jgi:hypothetical protein|nr:hypothetical protein [Myxococcaceae bacterium]
MPQCGKASVPNCIPSPLRAPFAYEGRWKMATPPDPRARIAEPALWVFGVGVLVFATRARLVWADGAHGWLLPFGLWLALILLGAIVNRRTD